MKNVHILLTIFSISFYLAAAAEVVASAYSEYPSAGGYQANIEERSTGRLDSLPTAIQEPTTEPLQVLQIDILIDRENQIYRIEQIAENSSDVAEWQIRIIDAQAGNTVETRSFYADREIIQFAANNLIPGAKYEIELSAIDEFGRLIKDGEGKTNLAQISFVHWQDEQITPEIVLDPIEIDREAGVFRVKLFPVNEELIAGYAGQLINDGDSALVRQFDVRLAEDNTFELSLDGLEPADYRVVIDALDHHGEIAASTEGEITYAPTQLSIWGRLSLGLRDRPYLLALVILILAFIIGYLVWLLRKDKKASGLPWASAQQKRGQQDAIYSPLSGTTMKPITFDTGFEVSESLSAPNLTQEIARLQILKSADVSFSGRYYAIEHTPYTLGREGCDLNIKGDKRVSRAHAQIEGSGGRFVIRDLTSTNGTFVNDIQVAADSPTGLKNGDVIRLGRMATIRFTTS